MIGQQIAEQLPQIVGEAAKAFGNIGHLTVLNGAEGIGQLFTQVLGMGAAAIPMLRGMLDRERRERRQQPRESGGETARSHRGQAFGEGEPTVGATCAPELTLPLS